MCDKLFDWAFGDNEDDLNEAFLQASAEFESKLRLVQQLRPWFWLSHLQQAPPTTTKPSPRLPVSVPRYQPIKLQYFK